MATGANDAPPGLRLDGQMDLAGTVDVVIVNWNAGDQLAACVRSVLAIEPDTVRSLTVVDNASADASMAFEPGSTSVRFLPQTVNLGFGRACNLGARDGRAPFILFLNPDTRLTEPSISAAVQFMREPANADVGVCGVRHVDERDETARHCARLPSAGTFLSESSGLTRFASRWFKPLHLIAFDHASSRSVDHVMGAFYLIRRSLFEQLGGFDEAFFVYLEDLDLSARVAKAGMRTHYLADTAIFHRGGGTSQQALGRALYYGLHSRLVYAGKHFGVAGRAMARLDVLAVYPLALMTRAALAGSRRRMSGIAQAYRLLWRHRGRHPADVAARDG